MNVIVGGRGSGKTYQLVKWYNEDRENRRIITGDHSSGRWLVENHGVDKKHIFNLSDIDRIRSHHGQFGLDIDLDWFLHNALRLDGVHQKLGPVTINGAAKDASTGEVISRSINNPQEQPSNEWTS